MHRLVSPQESNNEVYSCLAGLFRLMDYRTRYIHVCVEYLGCMKKCLRSYDSQK